MIPMTELAMMALIAVGLVASIKALIKGRRGNDGPRDGGKF
jgi:hypothetical protein